MAIENSVDQEFIKKLDKVIESNLSDDKFRVPQLASELGMSRYTLHRKVAAATKLSVSQYIRQVRLKNAKKLLREKSLSVSEVAYKVGFSSPIYFSKCFHEYFGYPPNKVAQREVETIPGYLALSRRKRLNAILGSIGLLIVIAVALFIFIKPFALSRNKIEKSVIVLFPIFNGTDSTYIHQINGTIDAIVNNLSLVGDLTVFPMSTTLKYKDSRKSGIEIAKELKAGYVIESSGFSYGNKIRLNIKLISASDGAQIWYNPYDVNTSDIIQLPLEIARIIANEIEAEITPDEKSRINSKPTDNTNAWDFYLKGRDMQNTGLILYYAKGDANNKSVNRISAIKSFEESTEYFRKALEHDNNFALAYAQLAITYYMIDIGSEKGKYSMEICSNADKAVLNDSQNDICLISKAYDYVYRGENKLAIPFLEKALKYNPKSVVSYRMLANIYNLTREANTEKYLENKLQVVKLSSLVEDSVQKSEDYRLAARALRVAGFGTEAEEYVQKSIELNPENYSSWGEKCEIIIERDNDYIKARELLFQVLSKDSINIEILRFLMTNYYLTREYQSAYEYFKLFSELDKSLFYLPSKDFSRLAVMFSKLNMLKESETFKNQFKHSDTSRMNSYERSNVMARLYSLENNKEKALEQLKILSQQDCHFSYTIRMLKDDSVYDCLRNLTEFNNIISEMESKFRTNHQRIYTNLKSKGLL